MNPEYAKRRICITALVISMVAVPFFGLAAPRIEQTLPGSQKGNAEARWIAPFVLAMRYSVGGNTVTTVRWFDEKGNVTQELSGLAVEAHDDYISERNGNDTVIHGINGQWKFALPNKLSPDIRGGYIAGRGDTFIHQFRPALGQTAVDVYASGKLVGSVGPFVEHRFGDPHLADDGSVTLMTWKTAEKKTVQVVAIGPDGKIRFQVDCSDDVYDPYPTANGEGILLRIDGLKEPPVKFRYVAPGLEPTAYDIGPNAGPVVCVPHGDRILFRTSIGEIERFRLVHGATGQVLWDIPSPVRYYQGAATSALEADGRILFLGRDVAAVELESGHLIARWESNSARAAWGRFFRQGNNVFLLKDREFFQLDLSDIEAKRNGWR